MSQTTKNSVTAEQDLLVIHIRDVEFNPHRLACLILVDLEQNVLLHLMDIHYVNVLLVWEETQLALLDVMDMSVSLTKIV